MPRTLPPNSVHVWHFTLGLDAATADTLSAEERARAARLRFPEVRRRFVAGRMALRQILADYLNADLAALRIATASQGGKPYLPDTSPDAPLHFNFSHSADRALLAVARQPLGVDIERRRPLESLWTMAETVFTAEERAVLAALPQTSQQAAFFRAWVRKEAALKAEGTGITDALRFRVPVTTDPLPQPAQVGSWQVIDLDAPTGFVAAVALSSEIETQNVHVVSGLRP